MSERTKRMKDAILLKNNPIGIHLFKNYVNTTEAMINIPPELRAGHVFANGLDTIPIFILEDELLVGHGASQPYGVEISSGYGMWDQGEVDQLKAEGFIISPEDEAELQELNKKFKPVGMLEGSNFVIEGNTRIDNFAQVGVMLPAWKPASEGNRVGGGRAQVGLGLDPGWGLYGPDWEMILQKGLRKMVEECEEQIQSLTYFDPDCYTRGVTLRAMKTSLEAIIRFAHRYAALAEEMAENETRAERKKELLEIAEICRWVPENPPRTFKEAFQMYWFIYLVAVLPNNTTAMGRLDQIFYPYYKADIEAGRITDEEVIEYFEMLRIKVMSCICVMGAAARKRQNGRALWHNCVIGGVKTDGSDATNELSYHIIEACIRTETPHHTISLRVAESTPVSLLQKAAQALAMGRCMPAFVGDKAFIEYYTRNGLPLETAREYCIAGCVDSVIPGQQYTVSSYMFATTMVLKIFMNRGVDENTGLKIGLDFPELGDYTDFETFYQDFLKELRNCLEMAGEMYNIEELVLRRSFPNPVNGMFMTEGIKQGKDSYNIKYTFHAPAVFNPVGMINLAQSLYDIKKLVFEEKVVTLPELKDILDANWAGHEDLRQRALSMPKYGNDIDDVDLFVARLYEDWVNIIETIPSSYGGHMMSSGVSISSYDPAGAATGATPDGRFKGQIVADACASPESGMDKEGFTAMLKSAMKIPQYRCQAFLFNQKFPQSALANDRDRNKFVNAVRIYMLNGGKQIQFNVVDNETLKAAQERPEEYESLLVRVAGYSTYFTILNKRMQDQIIARTSQTL